MAFTQSQLDALDLAISANTVKVEFQDRRVTYNSVDDMLKLRALIWNELHPAGTSPATNRQYRVITSSGL